MTDGVSLYPAWKQAAADLFAGKYSFGDVVSHEELQEALKLPKPTGRVEVAKYERWRLDLLSQVEALAGYLLEEKNMCLRALPGRGYEIVRPEDQTGFAMKDGMKRVGSEIRKMGRRLKFIDRSSLTSEQAKENADALSRLSFLSQEASRVKRLEFSEK
jgi:hypothetical protein